MKNKNTSTMAMVLMILLIVNSVVPVPTIANEFGIPDLYGDLGSIGTASHVENMRLECYKIARVPDELLKHVPPEDTSISPLVGRGVDVYAVVFRTRPYETIVTAEAWITHGHAVTKTTKKGPSFLVRVFCAIGGCLGLKSMLKDLDPAQSALLAPVVIEVFREFVFGRRGDTVLDLADACHFKSDEVVSLDGGSIVSVGLAHGPGTAIEFHNIVTTTTTASGGELLKYYSAPSVLVPGDDAPIITMKELAKIVRADSEPTPMPL